MRRLWTLLVIAATVTSGWAQRAEKECLSGERLRELCRHKEHRPVGSRRESAGPTIRTQSGLPHAPRHIHGWHEYHTVTDRQRQHTGADADNDTKREAANHCVAASLFML